MTRIVKIRKGLDIPVKGVAEHRRVNIKCGERFMLCPLDFDGVTPKVVVKEGEEVLVGDALFCNKAFPEVTFASPVSGTVVKVVRGERRKVLGIEVTSDAKIRYRDFKTAQPENLNAQEVIEKILKAGLFGYIKQRPYDISASPNAFPKSIFVSALRDKPLASDFEFELLGCEKDFQTGLTALSRVAKVHLGIGKKQTSKALLEAKDVTVTIYSGPCPAGNVGVQINKTDPINKGEIVWTVDPYVVIFIGRLFNTGHVDLRKTVALVGSKVKSPAYADMIVGQQLSDLLDTIDISDRKLRIINGNILTGRISNEHGYLSAFSSEITVISEGDSTNEFIGWLSLRLNQFSFSRTYFSWMFKKRQYAFDARIKGGKRHMIMSGEYSKVLPMDILPEYLIKAIIAGNIDKMEQLGIYEVAPEDFALAEFVDSSKLELQRIVRQGLDLMLKEES